MMVMVFAFWMYCIGAVLMRVRTVILERERRTAWAQEIAATGR
jgi:heme exporter protein C